MIKNEHQCPTTKLEAEKFECVIEDLVSKPNRSLRPKLRKAELDGLLSQLDDLRNDLQKY